MIVISQDCTRAGSNQPINKPIGAIDHSTNHQQHDRLIDPSTTFKQSIDQNLDQTCCPLHIELNSWSAKKYRPKSSNQRSAYQSINRRSVHQSNH